MKDDPEATVRALLAAAGLAPPEDEVANAIRSYPSLRAGADSMFSEEISRFAPVFLPTDEGSDAR